MAKVTCYDCGRVFDTENEDWILVYGGDYVCDECMDGWTTCDYCGEWVRRDETTYLPNYDWDVCDDCRLDHFYYCWGCDNIIHEDDWNFDYDCCENCAESKRKNELIHRYHGCKEIPLIFFKSVCERTFNIAVEKYLGIEWELCGSYIEEHVEKLHEILGDRANFEEDCTVDVECVFQPHSFDAIIESGEIKRAFMYAEEHLCHEAEEAGLHIHVSREAFGSTREEQDENIAKLAVLHTSGYACDKLVELSRRTDYALRWASPIRKTGTKKETIERAKRHVDYRDNDHGDALNVGNYDTVEFRLGAGTVNYDNFIAWVKIINMLVERSKTIDIEDADNFYMWFADADDTIKGYMARRGVKWEEPIKVTVDTCNTMIKKLMDTINNNCVASGAPALDYNQLLTVLCNASEQERAVLGYM